MPDRRKGACQAAAVKEMSRVFGNMGNHYRGISDDMPLLFFQTLILL